jgi:hypothetical protein
LARGEVAAAVAITRLRSEWPCGIGSGGTGLCSRAFARTGAATNSKKGRGHVAARNTLARNIVLVPQRATKMAPRTRVIEITAVLRRAPGPTADISRTSGLCGCAGDQCALARLSARRIKAAVVLKLGAFAGKFFQNFSLS